MPVKNIKKRVYIIVSSFVVLLLLSVFFISKHVLPLQASDSSLAESKGIQKVLAAITNKPSITLTPSPTASPTPTLTPKPSSTPIPVYTGYCLTVPVLMFHHIAPDAYAKGKGFTSLNVDNGIFDQQMAYLSSHGYTTIFGEDLVNALKNHATLPAKSIVITMDDGYQDIFDYAMPLLKKYNIKATLMIPTGLMNVSSAANSYLTWDELKTMKSSGLISFSNHSWSHHAMGTGTPDKEQFEVATPQKQLLDNLGKTVNTFTYPYGTNANSATVHTLLQSNGIIGAFSTIGGTTQCDSFIYSLHRVRVGNAPLSSYGI